MLIQIGVNEHLAKCHSLARRIPGSIVLWNGRCYYEVGAAVDDNNNNNKVVEAKLGGGILAAGATIYGVNAWLAWKSGDLGMSIVCGFFAFAPAAFAASSLAFRQNASDCTAFLNGLVEVENKWKKDPVFQKVVRANGLVKLLARTLIADLHLGPWLFTLVVSFLPCSPLNMFSSVMGLFWWCDYDDDGEAKSWPQWLLRVATALGTAAPQVAFWKSVFARGVMDSMHIVLGSMCQLSLLRFMEERRLIGSGGHGHGHPFQFLNLYRTSQLLNVCFGNYSASLVFSIIAVDMVAEISLTFLILKSLHGGVSNNSNNNLPLLMIIILAALCCTSYLIHMVMLSVAAAVNTSSISALRKANRVRVSGHGHGQKSKLSRLQFRSLRPVKVKFGQCNFIEAATTLVMLDFIIRRLVDLLIIGNK